MSETQALCPRCGLAVIRDEETNEWVCVYCGFVSSNRPTEQPIGSGLPRGADFVNRIQLLNRVSQQFGKEKVDDLLKDEPALKEAWHLQLLGEVAKEFGRDKADELVRDEPGLKHRWDEFVESPVPSPISVASPRPDKLWYLAPIFFSVVGGIVAYAVVRDNDKSMAETCLVLGFLVLLVQLFLLFIR